jgi:hypothetical protein
MKDAPTEVASATCRSKHTGSRDQSSRSRQRHQRLWPAINAVHNPIEGDPEPAVEVFSDAVALSAGMKLSVKISGSKKETAN